jgi:hypothetical protein
VTVVAGRANADFERTTLAAEETMAVNHRILLVTFLDTAPMSRDAPLWNVASITGMIRKARGCYPGLSPFVSSAIELPDDAGASNNPARDVRLVSRTIAWRARPFRPAARPRSRTR